MVFTDKCLTFARNLKALYKKRIAERRQIWKDQILKIIEIRIK